MNVSPESLFPRSSAPQADEGEVRSKADAPRPIPGNASQRENSNPLRDVPAPVAAQDEVELQWDSEDQIAIYKFLDRRGNLVLQVPSEQMIDLAREIQQQLRNETAARRALGNRGGKVNDH